MQMANRFSVLCCAVVGAASLWNPVCSADSEAGLGKAALTAASDAVAAVRSGKGKIRATWHMVQADGRIVDIENDYDVVFCGNRFRFVGASTYSRNDPLSVKKGQRTISAGEVVHIEAAYDGEQITLASSGDDDFLVTSTSSPAGRRAYQMYLLDMNVPWVGLCAVGRSPSELPSGWSVGEPQLVGRELVEGDECLVVQTLTRLPATPGSGRSDTTSTIWMWVNPSKGYTVPLIRKWAQGGITSERRLMTEARCKVRQYGDVWGPSEIVVDQYGFKAGTNEYYNSTHRTILFDPAYVLNTDVSESELCLQIPPGAVVRDELMDAEYTMP